jgi:hypothetical protein
MNSQPEYWKSLDIADFFFDRPALLNHAEMLRCVNILVRSRRNACLLKKIAQLIWLVKQHVQMQNKPQTSTQRKNLQTPLISPCPTFLVTLYLLSYCDISSLVIIIMAHR